MDVLIGFLFGVAAVVGFMHGTKGNTTGKRAFVRKMLSGGGGGGNPAEPL